MKADRSFRISLILAFFALFLASPKPAPLAQRPETYIRINQAGYQPTGVKSALAFSTAPLAGSFFLIEAGSGQIVFAGKLSEP
jgi:hypothetical protein